jgi:hypothetical protein
MEILEHGAIVNESELDGPLRVHTFTSLFQAMDGSILAIYRVGSAKDSADGNCQVARSADGGRSWEIVSQSFGTDLASGHGEIRTAQLAQNDDGSLVAYLTWIDQSSDDPRIYDPQTDFSRLSKFIRIESRDGGRTWSEGHEIETGALTRLVLCGPALRLSEGAWLVPVENYAPEREGGPNVHSAHMLRIRDGETTAQALPVARHPEDRLYYWDQREALTPDGGRIAALFWTYDREEEHDVSIHISWCDSQSLEWQTPTDTGITGQIAQPIPLKDGRLLAFYVRRESPGSMRLIASFDDGKTWSRDDELIVYCQGGGDESHQPNDYADAWKQMSLWTFGHPAAILLEDDLLLLLYYAGPHDRCLLPCWARVRI